MKQKTDRCQARKDGGDTHTTPQARCPYAPSKKLYKRPGSWFEGRGGRSSTDPLSPVTAVLSSKAPSPHLTTVRRSRPVGSGEVSTCCHIPPTDPLFASQVLDGLYLNKSQLSISFSQFFSLLYGCTKIMIEIC